MNKKGDVVYFVFLKTKDGKEIEDMTPCITLKKAISHGVHLAKVYENVSKIEIEEYSSASYENGVRTVVYSEDINRLMS